MPPGRPIALRSPSPFESDGCDRGSEDFPAAPTDGTLSCFRRDAWEPVIGLVPSRGSGSSLVGGLPGVRTASAQDYFKSGCEQQPSPKARETRPPRGRVFRFLRRDFEGWARAGGRRVSLSLNRRVARTPPLADRMGRKSLRVSPREGAGLRVGRARWSGHYPRGRERWGATEPVRTATRG